MKVVGAMMIVAGGLLVWWSNHYAVGHTATTAGTNG